MKRIAILFSGALALPVAAHHGRDFLFVQDAAVPVPFTGLFYTNFSFAAHTGPDEWSAEPGAVWGLGSGFAAAVTAQFMDEGNGWDFASVSPQIQWQIPVREASAVRFALLAGYQFGDGAAAVGSHVHDAEEEAVCGPEYGPDAPPCGEESAEHEHAHVHRGIHQHGTDAFFARVVMEADLADKTRLALNLITVIPDGEAAQWGYAAGLRHTFSNVFSAGIEVLGDFRRSGYHEVATAAYFSPTHDITLKFGIGAGLTDESPDVTVHTGVLFRF
jgi:hypothetical protein